MYKGDIAIAQLRKETYPADTVGFMKSFNAAIVSSEE